MDKTFIEDPLLNEEEYAALARISVSKAQKDRVKGVGPKFLKISRSVRYRQSAVESYLMECERRSTSQSPPPRKNTEEE